MLCFLVIEKLIKLVEMKEGGEMKISNLINRNRMCLLSTWRLLL